MVRKGVGRKKVEIKRIEDENSRQVTFSKGRTGLFKKATELGVLCGAETAVIVFSPARKAFSFGHPCINTIVDRFLTQIPSTRYYSIGLWPVYACYGTGLEGLSRRYTDLLNQLEEEKRKGVWLEELKKEREGKNCWDLPIDDLSLDELEKSMAAMEELKKSMVKRANEILIGGSSSTPFLPMNSVAMVNPYITDTKEG